MHWASSVQSVATAAEAGMLLYAAWTDVAARIIPNFICLGIAAATIIKQLLIGPTALLEGLLTGFVVLLPLWLLFSRSVIGGGDVKLLAALAIDLSFQGVVSLFAITALAGGVLVLVHLAMRCLPRPRLVKPSSILRRVYTAERWRILRRAPLPYGVAIACGGIITIMSTGV
jgi:prepilin peptidase CpaA